MFRLLLWLIVVSAIVVAVRCNIVKYMGLYEYMCPAPKNAVSPPIQPPKPAQPTKKRRSGTVPTPRVDSHHTHQH